MKLHFTECNIIDEGLFADFAKYKTVDKYFQALVDVFQGKIKYMGEDCPNFVPLDCSFRDFQNGSIRRILSGGQVCEDAEKNIKWLKRQRADVRHFMSDGIVVKGDAFERELFVSWENM